MSYIGLTDRERMEERAWLLNREWRLGFSADLLDPTAEKLTSKHEGDLMAEWGPDALIRYYQPSDPRLEPLR